MTFSTALELKFDGIHAEADFVSWRRKDNFEYHNKPELLIGEAKSLGNGELLNQKDFIKLKQIGKKLPGAFIVISVLRDTFTSSERKLLITFVKWCRRLNKDYLATNPVILLTSNELLFDFSISISWRSLGDNYKKFADYDYTHNLHGFADATQQIYLGIESMGELRDRERNKKWQKQKQKQKNNK